MSDRDEAERASIRSSLEAQTASSRQTGAFVWRLPKAGIRQNLPLWGQGHRSSQHDRRRDLQVCGRRSVSFQPSEIAGRTVALVQVVLRHRRRWEPVRRLQQSNEPCSPIQRTGVGRGRNDPSRRPGLACVANASIYRLTKFACSPIAQAFRPLDIPKERLAALSDAGTVARPGARRKPH
jgi:hypothetical protein